MRCWRVRAVGRKLSVATKDDEDEVREVRTEPPTPPVDDARRNRLRLGRGAADQLDGIR